MKRIAVINDMSGFGRCSLTAAIPIISVMGHEACPLPTAILSNQTGYKDFYCDDFTDRMPLFNRHWKKLCPVFDGIFTGYIANIEQVNFLSEFIDSFSNENTLVLVDPVMGDDGKIYSAYSDKMCQRLISLIEKAHIITPNLTELCIISNESYKDISVLPASELLNKVEQMSRSLIRENLTTVITTGIPLQTGDGEYLATAVLWKDGFNSVTAPKIEGTFSGTGDIFASIVCSSLLNGQTPVSAVIKAMNFISAAIEETVKHPYDRNDGIDFQKFLKKL